MKIALIAYLAAFVGATIGFIVGAAVRVGKESDLHEQSRLRGQKRDL